MKKIIGFIFMLLVSMTLVSCNSNPKPNLPNGNGNQVLPDNNDGSGVGTNEEIFE